MEDAQPTGFYDLQGTTIVPVTSSQKAGCNHPTLQPFRQNGSWHDHKAGGETEELLKHHDSLFSVAVEVEPAEDLHAMASTEGRGEAQGAPGYSSRYCRIVGL